MKWIVTRYRLLDLVSHAAKYLGTVSPGCGPKGRAGFLVGVSLRRVVLPMHRCRCVGVETAARDGDHGSITIDVDGPTELQKHNDTDDE